jgi:predicted aminopeptidase
LNSKFLPEPIVRRKKLLSILSIVVLVVFLSGCQNVSYYRQAIGGQMRILTSQRPLEKLIQDPRTPPELREKFRLILALREFAETELELPVKGHYLQYADLKRPHVVWSVTATPEFSFAPKSWWFPLVGHLTYRGYFAEEAARKYAAQLENEGLEVYVSGVGAYSTLGWFSDPVLNTFINRNEIDLAELVFHELAHQRLFIPGDTDFNEAFATAVAEEGLRRWMLASGNMTTYSEYKATAVRHQQFLDLVLSTRTELKQLYQSKQSHADAATVREKKNELVRDMFDQYQALKTDWNGYSGYDRWFSGPLNNAQLGTVSTYYSLVPAFQQLLWEKAGDLPAFYVEVSQLGRLGKPARHAELRHLLAKSEARAAEKLTAMESADHDR